jgi:hemerythrin superfamily protein
VPEPFDVIELLIQDHRVMSRLLQQLDEQEQPEKLRLLYLQLVETLFAHEEAEQQLVFPALRLAIPAAEQETANRLAEHREVNELVAEMRGLSPNGPEFEKRASALTLELERHFLNEEESMFPWLRGALPHGELLALAERAEAVERCARGQRSLFTP